jgi:hypothetical protein
VVLKRHSGALFVDALPKLGGPDDPMNVTHMNDPKASTGWGKFESGLEAAFKEFRRRPDDREWAIQALQAVHLFVAESLPDKHKLIYILIEALINLETGIVAPILQPRIFPYRPPDSFGLRLLKIRAAVAMDLLMDNGENRRAAAEKVADMLECLNLEISKDKKRDFTWTKVASWRDQLKKEKRNAAKNTISDQDILVELDPTLESGVTNVDRLKMAATMIMFFGGKDNDDPFLIETLKKNGIKIIKSDPRIQDEKPSSYELALAKERNIISEDRADSKFPGIEDYVLDRLLLFGVHSDNRWVANMHSLPNIAPKAFARYKRIIRRLDGDYASLVRLMR